MRSEEISADAFDYLLGLVDKCPGLFSGLQVVFGNYVGLLGVVSMQIALCDHGYSS